MSYDPIFERNKMLQAEYLDRLARARSARIPPSKPISGPDWRSKTTEMIERVRALRQRLKEPLPNLDDVA